jgi:hypothetical protein
LHSGESFLYSDVVLNAVYLYNLLMIQIAKGGFMYTTAAAGIAIAWWTLSNCMEFKASTWKDDESRLAEQIKLTQDFARKVQADAEGDPVKLARTEQVYHENCPSFDVYYHGQDLTLRQAVGELRIVRAKREWIESKPYTHSYWFRYFAGIPPYKARQTPSVEDILVIGRGG